MYFLIVSFQIFSNLSVQRVDKGKRGEREMEKRSEEEKVAV